MKKLFLSAIAVFVLNSCQNDGLATDSSFKMQTPTADYTAACALPVQVVSGTITTNTTWTNDRVYAISGVLRVIGARLTIQSGTFIKAVPLSAGVATGVLVITKTGKIDAQGTVEAPIIFTSHNLLDCNVNTSPQPGDFGGVVILGDAMVNTNVTRNIAQGLSDQANITDFYYGGTNNAHNGGNLKYIRIEYAGRMQSQSDDLAVNGLTFGGVGNGTTVDHIQVSYARDDAFEFFGGTINASHLVAFAACDDNFDFNYGYTGTITKAIALADKNSIHNFSGGNPDSNAIELDNNYTGSFTTLITRPILREWTIIGLKCPDHIMLENGIHVRRLGQIELQDVTVTGYNIGINWEVPSYFPDNSLTSMVYVHGATHDILPAGTLLYGFDNDQTVGCPMATWGITQPFFNAPGFDLSGNTGAFTTELNWTNIWTKFDGLN